MKPLLQLHVLAALVWLQSCGGIIKQSGVETAEAAPAKIKTPVPVAGDSKIIRTEKDLTGYWVGALRYAILIDTDPLTGNPTYYDKLNLSIDTIDGNKVSGHTIVAGSFRPFSGTIDRVGNTYKFLVKQPGDKKNDGVFSFSVGIGDSVIKGSWTANRKIKTHVRYYSLTKKIFRYDARLNAGQTKNVLTIDITIDDEGTVAAWNPQKSDYPKLNASVRVLNTADVSNLTEFELRLLRNCIFARHGYSFKDPELRAYFDQQDWYIPVSTNVTGELTAIEKKNIALIQRYENNAKAYYDKFGR